MKKSSENGCKKGDPKKKRIFIDFPPNLAPKALPKPKGKHVKMSTSFQTPLQHAFLSIFDEFSAQTGPTVQCQNRLFSVQERFLTLSEPAYMSEPPQSSLGGLKMQILRSIFGPQRDLRTLFNLYLLYTTQYLLLPTCYSLLITYYLLLSVSFI